MRKPHMSVLIHVPRFEEYSFADALEYVQNMMDFVLSTSGSGQSVKIRESSWHFEAKGANRVLGCSGDDITSWRRCAETYGDNLECIGGTIKCRKGLTNDVMDIRMYVRHEFQQINRELQGERSISFAIPEMLWRNIDPVAFGKQICEVACTLKATYACLDTLCFPIGSLHFTWFRLLCEKREELDLEDMLPGIYWGQYITQRMVAKTASLDEIVAQAPCESKKMYSEGELKGVWLQLPSTPIKTSIESRQALRRYFERSLYAISPEIAKRYHNMPFKLMDFDTLPLLPEERLMLE